MEKVKHVLGLSGGKDSSALALYVKETRPELDIAYFFTDTGYELPETNQFIDQLEEKLGYIHRLNERSLNNIPGSLYLSPNEKLVSAFLTYILALLRSF